MNISPKISPRSPKHKQLFAIALVALVALAVSLEYKNRSISAQLHRLTVRMEQLQLGNKEQNQETAQRVILEVRKLIDIPTDIEPTVATIIDVETLRAQNPFYNKAENGFHLIVTPDRAILYDPDQKKIIDVVPVQLEPLQ